MEKVNYTCANCDTTDMLEMQFHPVTKLYICYNCFRYYKKHNCERPFLYENKRASKELRKHIKCCNCNMILKNEKYLHPITKLPSCWECSEYLEKYKSPRPLPFKKGCKKEKNSKKPDINNYSTRFDIPFNFMNHSIDYHTSSHRKRSKLEDWDSGINKRLCNVQLKTCDNSVSNTNAQAELIKNLRATVNSTSEETNLVKDDVAEIPSQFGLPIGLPFSTKELQVLDISESDFL